MFTITPKTIPLLIKAAITNSPSARVALAREQPGNYLRFHEALIAMGNRQQKLRESWWKGQQSPNELMSKVKKQVDLYARLNPTLSSSTARTKQAHLILQDIYNRAPHKPMHSAASWLSSQLSPEVRTMQLIWAASKDLQDGLLTPTQAHKELERASSNASLHFGQQSPHGSIIDHPAQQEPSAPHRQDVPAQEWLTTRL